MLPYTLELHCSCRGPWKFLKIYLQIRTMRDPLRPREMVVYFSVIQRRLKSNCRYS